MDYTDYAYIKQMLDQYIHINMKTLSNRRENMKTKILKYS